MQKNPVFFNMKFKTFSPERGCPLPRPHPNGELGKGPMRTPPPLLVASVLSTRCSFVPTTTQITNVHFVSSKCIFVSVYFKQQSTNANNYFVLTPLRKIFCRWRRSVVVSGVGLINEVNRHRARLVLGWVTVCVTSHLGQLSLPSLRGR